MATEKNNDFPLEIVDIDPKLMEELNEQFTVKQPGFIFLGPKKYFLPGHYRQEASKIYNMPLKKGDVFVVTYPRSGTTWTQELVWLVANDLDYETSNAVPLTARYPFLEFSMYFHPEVMELLNAENSGSERNLEILKSMAQSGTELVAAMPSPRFVKTHLPLSLLPPTILDTAKVVYVARDPRDVAVSFYHLNRTMRFQGYAKDFKTFWQYYIKGLQPFTPIFEHIKEAWKQRHNPNLLFLFYEDLAEDLPAVVRKVSTFFNKQYTEEQVTKLCDHLSFENFKKNKSVNYDDGGDIGLTIKGAPSFIRKGKAGGWRDYFDEDMMREADKWIADNLKDTDFRFPHISS